MRIKLNERIRLLLIANKAISKMNSEKNKNKSHWRFDGLVYLLRRLQEENNELRDAILLQKKDEIIDECKDNINFALMISDNVSRSFTK